MLQAPKPNRLYRKMGELNADGVRITVEWEKFTVGASFFVPCIQVDTLKQQVKAIAKKHEWEIITQNRVEKGIRGVRVWRVQ